MHEHAFAAEIADSVLERATGRRVTGIKLSIGAFSGVVEDPLRFYLDLILEEKGLKGVEIAVRTVPARCRCACGNEYEILGFTELCPKCGGYDRRIEGGRECVIESAEVEDA